MRTPNEYTKNLKNKVITKEMLKDCLYSVNKRAKNCRDKEREYRDYYRNSRYAYDKYDTTEKYQEQKEAYYQCKEKLLSILKPSCIHIEFYGYERVRVYDYEPQYISLLLLKADAFVWQNCYWDSELEGWVYFGDYEDKENPLYHYYLFYELGDRTFHSPIDEEDLNMYSKLPQITIDRIITYGNEVQELISVQFVRKVIALIESKEYELI